jgi:hypothetical protein
MISCLRISDVTLQPVVSYQYGSVQSILNDIQLMVHNAEEFNGKNTVIVADANSVYCDLQLAFTHDKKFLGAAKDEYTILENAIRKKYVVINELTHTAWC